MLAPKTEDIFNSIYCKSAEEFVLTLRKSNILFARGSSSPYIFRGHSDASWPLIPSFFRQDINLDAPFQYWHRHFQKILKSFESASLRDPFKKARLLENVENKLLVDFALRSNLIGLQVPELEKAYAAKDALFVDWETAVPAINPNTFEFDLNAMMNTLAMDVGIQPLFAGLAQHHGVKTRLLDFTYNPQKAIFFAVHGNVDADEICVWAIPQSYFNDNLFVRAINLEKNSDPDFLSKFSLMVMATSSNDYLYRQEGLFVYPRFPHDFNSLRERYPSVLDFITTIQKTVIHHRIFLDDVYKIFVPSSERGSIKRILKLEGLTLSTLMPTFDNIVSEMRDNPDGTF